MVRHINPGDPDRRSARDWNEIADFVNHGRKARTNKTKEPWSQTKLLVQNTTGDALPQGSVLELDGPAIDELKNEFLWFLGDTPNGLRVPVICTTQHPDEKFIECVVAGCALALVDVTHTADRFCYVESGSHALKGCAIGHHRILEVPTSTGEQLLLVTLGNGVLSCYGRADTAIASNDYGTVRVYSGTPGAEADTGQTIPGCWNHGPLIPDELKVAVSILHGQFYVTPLECA